MATQVKSKNKNKKMVQDSSKKMRSTRSVTKSKGTIDPQNLKAIEFLDSMDNVTPEEIEEQKETWALLKKALNEDRPSLGRPLFPDELSGSETA